MPSDKNFCTSAAAAGNAIARGSNRRTHGARGRQFVRTRPRRKARSVLGSHPKEAKVEAGSRYASLQRISGRNQSNLLRSTSFSSLQ